MPCEDKDKNWGNISTTHKECQKPGEKHETNSSPQPSEATGSADIFNSNF